jgi:hypothetical protein
LKGLVIENKGIGQKPARKGGMKKVGAFLANPKKEYLLGKEEKYATLIDTFHCSQFCHLYFPVSAIR